MVPRPDPASSDQVVVRPDSPHSPEARALIDILSSELQRHYGSDGRASFAEWRDDPAFIFVLAWQGGEAVGCGAVRPIAPGVGELKRMFAKQRRAGIGTAILLSLERRAAAAGYRELWLETRAANTGALAFYRSHGYRVRENFGKYIGNPLAVCLEKPLTPPATPTV